MPAEGNWSMIVSSPYVFSSTRVIFICQPAAWKQDFTEVRFLKWKFGTWILSTLFKGSLIARARRARPSSRTGWGYWAVSCASVACR